MAVGAAMILSSSLTVCAAPEITSDGIIFDAEWYLEKYPDLSNLEKGTSKEALYEHYLNYGIIEERIPCDLESPEVAALMQSLTNVPIPKQETEVAAPQIILIRDDGWQLTTDDTVFAVEGTTYQMPARSTYEEKMTAGVRFQRIQEDSIDEAVREVLKPYELSGYEWKVVHAVFDPDPAVPSSVKYGINPYTEVYVDGSNNWTRPVSLTVLGKYSEGTQCHVEANFSVIQNGVEYPECIVICSDNILDKYNNYTKKFYVLVPKNYTGNISILVGGSGLSRSLDGEVVHAYDLRFCF